MHRHLFQVNGPVGLKNWKDYCYDLTDAEITKGLYHLILTSSKTEMQ